MIQDIEPKALDNAYKEKTAKPQDTVVIFRGRTKREHMVLCRRTEEGVCFPTAEEMGTEVDREKLQYLFCIDEQDFYLDMEFDLEPEVLPEGFGWESVRIFRSNHPKDQCFAGMTAYHLFDWYRTNRFCGMCGRPMVHEKNLRAMKCPSCGNLVFPKICPAVIIGVKNGDKILTSHYAGRAYKGIALLAGFVEIGETPEQTVAREVMEEVGVKVKNITYYKSQPWGCDTDLLMGYYCDLDGSGSITLDEEELANASWTPREELHVDDPDLSLTACMIEDFHIGKVK